MLKPEIKSMQTTIKPRNELTGKAPEKPSAKSNPPIYGARGTRNSSGNADSISDKSLFFCL